MADVVEIFLALRNARKFIEDASKASQAVTGVGDAAEKSGKKAGVSWKGLAKWAGGATALYAGTKYIKGSISATEDLGKATLALQRTTGMDVETSSAWASVAKSRGIATKQLQVGFVKLSREMEKSRKASSQESMTMQKLNAQYKAVSDVGGKKAPTALAKISRAMDAARDKGDKARKTLADLGVTQKALTTGNTQAVLGQVAQGLSKIQNPARRAALAQQLFGRGGQALLPILMKGRQGIQDQLAVVRKYGDTLGVKTVDQLKELIAHEREMRVASDGMKVQLGTALMPVLFEVSSAIVKLTRVLQPFIRQGWFVKAMLGALVLAFTAYKVAIFTTTIMQLGLTAATWAWIGVIALVVLALVALGIGFVVLYKKVGWFRAGVDAMWSAMKAGAQVAWQVVRTVFNWIKQNWPLLLGIMTGPFGLAAVLIIRHFRQVKDFALGVVTAIKTAIENLWKFMRSLPANVAKGITSKIPGPIQSAVGAATGLFGGKHFRGQHGGVVPYRSRVLVGEGGPEVLTLPGGAQVTPLPTPPALDTSGAFSSAEIVVPLTIDGRVVAQATARYTSDKLARR